MRSSGETEMKSVVIRPPAEVSGQRVSSSTSSAASGSTFSSVSSSSAPTAGGSALKKSARSSASISVTMRAAEAVPIFSASSPWRSSGKRSKTCAA